MANKSLQLPWKHDLNTIKLAVILRIIDTFDSEQVHPQEVIIVVNTQHCSLGKIIVVDFYLSIQHLQGSRGVLM